MNKIDELIKIADIHAEKINLAINRIKNIFPLNAKKIENFDESDMLYNELLISRFAKLQDYIGNVMIDEFLKITQDYSSSMTMIDKINKLEKLRIINSKEIWQDMRDARNHVSHEYPNKPELTAKYLNQIFNLAPFLIEILENVKSAISTIR